MRTTLTLDPDVAARLRQRRDRDGRSFKDVVNDLLRRGLDAEAGSAAAPASEPHTAPKDLGRMLLANVDDVSEALAVAEGEWTR